MIISFWGYTFQIATLYIAVAYPSIAWPIAIIGSVVAGFTSACWWTCQGICFEETCTKTYEAAQNESSNNNILSLNEIRANLSAYWTIIYQSSDIVVFLSLSLLPLYANIDIKSVLIILTILGIITALLGITFDNLGYIASKYDFNEIIVGVTAVPIQFSTDCRSILLAPFVFGFGISTAMFAFFVNDFGVSAHLGDVSLGLLEAFSYFIATISAWPYAYVSNHLIHGQHYVIQFGSLSFLITGVIVFILNNNQLGTWVNLLVLKGIYGLGRGVFEGSCRAAYAEMFVGKDLSTAFSGQTLLAGFSGGICYFIYGALNKDAIGMITVVNGIFAIISYYLLTSLDYKTPQSYNNLYDLILIILRIKSDNKQLHKSTDSNLAKNFLLDDQQTPMIAINDE